MVLDILRKLHRHTIPTEELEELYSTHKDSYRIVLALIQKRNFPVNISLGIVPKLFTPDLLLLMKNRMSNPQLRKRAEQEFLVKYRIMPSGEKMSLVKRAHPELLSELIFEEKEQILEQIFRAPGCITSVVFSFLLQAKVERYKLYNALTETRWLKERDVAEYVVKDEAAPVRAKVEALQGLSDSALRKVAEDESQHKAVTRAAFELFRKRIES